MQDKQRGGLVVFSLVAIALFAVLVGGVYATKHYGSSLAGEDSQVATTDETETEEMADEPADEPAQEPAQPETEPEAEPEPESEPSNQTPEAVSEETSDDDYDEVVEAPDDDEHSQSPGAVGSSGPNEVAATGPTDWLSLLPVAALTSAGIAYVRSRSLL